MDFVIPQPMVPKKQEPDFRANFYKEMPDMRPNRGHDRMATVFTCVYTNGRHESPPKPWCPHFKVEDETGFRINPSWTVQWDRIDENGNEMDSAA
jgi:hypothetical protein